MPTRPVIWTALATFALFAAGCTDEAIEPPPSDSLSSPIVGGTPTEAYDHAVAIYQDHSFICSGTLVSATTVVTAAHCLDGVAGDLKVFFGVNAMKPWRGTVIDVDHFEAHPAWNPATLRNDIGVMHLAEDAPVDPAPLMEPGTFGNPFIGEKARFLGFGATNWLGAGVGLKRQVDIEIVGVAAKKFRYADPTGNTCYGDSGGGGYVYHDGEWKLAGVTSYGDQWCQLYGVSTRSDAYIDWLAPLVDEDGGGQAPDATELTIGHFMGGSVAAGDTVLYWFPTFDNQRYDVQVQTQTGDVDLYVHAEHDVSPQTNTCASEAAPGEVESCAIADGGNDDYWVMVKGNDASLFQVIYAGSDPTCHVGVNGEADYCTEGCPCTVGEGDCQASDDLCAVGLRCEDGGPDYGLAEGVFVCEFPSEAGPPEENLP